MFFFEDSDWIPVLILWVAFMAVVGVYVIRIGIMLVEQRATERNFRLHLAVKRGRAAREAAGAVRSPENAGSASS